jgi:hypothetical protein
MFKWIKDWWFHLFGPEDIQVEMPITAKRQKKKRVKRKTIKNLKGDIDHVFDVLGHTDFVNKHGISMNTDKWTIEGLRELGPFMMPSTDWDTYATDFECSSLRNLPFMVFVGFPIAIDGMTDFAYAIKLKKTQFRQHLEWIHKSEEMYELGQGYIEHDPPRWRKRTKNQIVWVHFFWAINKKTGKSRLLKWKESKTKKVGNNYITQTEWISAGEEVRKWELGCLLNCWSQRDMHWQIAAETGGRKVTTCIPQNDAKYYFTDRAIDDGGKRKAIFHWVKAHYRKTKKGRTPVKTHFRGNREFQWGEYDIHIKVPGLHGHMLSDFSIAGDLAIEGQSEEGFMNLKETVRKLEEFK